MEERQAIKIYLDEPRLRMTYGGRFLVRLFAVIGNVSFVFGMIALLLSEDVGMKYLGVLFLLAIIDRVRSRSEGDEHLMDAVKKDRINAADYINGRTYRLIEKAFERSLIKHNSLHLEIIDSLLGESVVEDGLRRLDVDPKEFSQKLSVLLKESNLPATRIEKYRMLETLLVDALRTAFSSGHRAILVCDIFSSLVLSADEESGRLFRTFSLTAKDLEQAMVFSRASVKARAFSLSAMIPEGHKQIRHRVMNRAWTARPTPFLDSFAIDYTDLARSGDVGLLIGHDKEYTRLVEILSKPVNPNALLVGEAGIGKETIIAHLAFAIIKDKVPPALFDRRLVGVDLSRLIAGAEPQEVQARVQRIAEEINSAENIILYLPDIHNLLKTSGEAYLSAADAFLPIIQNGRFPVIGATYPREMKRDIEQRSDFTGLFERINVEEISEEEAERVLTLSSILVEKKLKIEVGFGAIKTAVRLAKKYFRGGKYLPTSADELLKMAAAKAKDFGKKRVAADDVMSVVESRVNVPVREADKDETDKLLNFEKIVHEKFIDQEEAVKAVGDSLRAYRSGLARKGGPIASFLFVGPTGVGKTELAKLIAKIQFGSKEMMVRFDMTEYQDKQSFQRFIGSADGEVRGSLTDQIIEKPYSIILLDEFEKAYPDILNLFLQVLDDGRLTDGMGRVVDFQNTIIVATSNAHSDIINEALNSGQSISEVAEYLKKKLTDVFKPELINRFSKVVIFRDLAVKELELIAKLQLAELAETLAEQGINLSFDDSVAPYIARSGYDRAFGARPIRRVIEDKFRAALAEKILRKEIYQGSDVQAAVVEENIVFKSRE